MITLLTTPLLSRASPPVPQVEDVAQMAHSLAVKAITVP
jgi:hypothetical protein